MTDAQTHAIPASVRTGLLLDAQHLDASTEFWTSRFDFRELGRRNAGLLTEERDFHSPMFPEILLTLRCTGARPGRGSMLGSLRSIILYVPDLARFARERLQGIEFINPPPADGSPVTVMDMEEPSRYRLQLRDGPRAGS